MATLVPSLVNCLWQERWHIHSWTRAMLTKALQTVVDTVACTLISEMLIIKAIKHPSLVLATLFLSVNYSTVLIDCRFMEKLIIAVSAPSRCSTCDPGCSSPITKAIRCWHQIIHHDVKEGDLELLSNSVVNHRNSRVSGTFTLFPLNNSLGRVHYWVNRQWNTEEMNEDAQCRTPRGEIKWQARWWWGMFMAGTLLRGGPSLLAHNEHLPCVMVVPKLFPCTELPVIFIKMCPNCSRRRVRGRATDRENEF